MENLILSFTVVFPLFANMILGYGLKSIHLLDEGTTKNMNTVVFKVFLPLLLFNNIYKTNLNGIFNGKILGFAALSIIALFIILCILIPIIEKDNKKRGVMIQGIFRSNFVIFGLPVATALFGDGQVCIIALLIAVVVPLFNFLSVIALEIFRGGKIDIKNVLKGIITNPLIIASTIGLTFLFLNIKLPGVLEKSVEDISKIATPLSLILLGATFEFKAIKANLKQTIISVVGRLVILPSIMLPLSAFLGFRNVELVGLMLIFGAPTAVSSFTMAEKMDGDAELASQIVVFTSAFCILTVFIWIFILKQLALI